MKGFMLSEILQQNTTYFLRYFNEGLHAISALTLTQSKSEQLNTLNKPIQTARSWGSVVAVFPEIVKKKHFYQEKLQTLTLQKLYGIFFSPGNATNQYLPLGFWLGLIWLTHSLTFVIKGAQQNYFWLQLGFCPNKGGRLTQSQFFRTTTIQNGDFVEILSQYGRGVPSLNQKITNHQKHGNFHEKKNNMLKTAYVIQNKHFFLFWNPNFRARLGQNTNINQKLVWLAHFERNHFGFWSLWEVWSCWKKQKYKILFLNVIVFVFI